MYKAEEAMENLRGEKGLHTITGLGVLRQGRGNKSVFKIGVWFCFAIFFPA